MFKNRPRSNKEQEGGEASSTTTTTTSTATKEETNSLKNHLLLKGIKNKFKRQEVHQKLQQRERKLKFITRMKTRKLEEANPSLKVERLAQNIPSTLENTREFDETLVEPAEGGEADAEVLEEEGGDEFSSYFGGGVEPKVLITTSRRPTKSVYEFATEFTSIFPSSQFVKRSPQFEVKKIVELAIERDFSDVIIINEDRKEPNAITIIHLPNGPTAYFTLTSQKLNSEIRGHGKVGPHKPELILNNFSTRLGHTIGRMFASLFPHTPEFTGRQACTFHNQRDFIFFRRHRYIFREDGTRCDIQEIGPRFTLKLGWVQKGTFDRKAGEYEWRHKAELDTSRRKFHL